MLDWREQVQNCVDAGNVINTITNYQGEPNIGLYIGIGVAIACSIGGLVYMRSKKNNKPRPAGSA